MNRNIYNVCGKLYKKLTGNDVAPYEDVYGSDNAGKKQEKHAVPPGKDPAEAPEPAGEPAEDETPPSGRKRKLIAICAAAALLLAIVGLVVNMSLNSTVLIPLIDTVSVTTPAAMSGYGTLDCALDEEALVKLIASTKQARGLTEEQVRAVAQKVIEAASVTADKSSKLSNGEVVTITATVDPAHTEDFGKFNFSGGSKTYTIAGLSVGMPVEPFSADTMTLRVEGISGCGEAFLDLSAQSSYIYYLNYDWEPRKGLSNGDTVTVTISPNREKLIELGYVCPTKLSYPCLVAGLPEYIDDPSVIPNTLLNSMVNHAEGELAEDFSAIQLDELDKVVVSPEITSIYFFDNSDKSAPYSDWFSGLEMNNGVAVLGHFFVQDVELVPEETAEGGMEGHEEVKKTLGGYYMWVFPDVVQNTDGSITFNKTMVTKKPTSYQTEDDFINWAKREFTGFSVMKIGSNEPQA